MFRFDQYCCCGSVLEHGYGDDVAAGPDIFRYLDYRAYLRDWFDSRKAANPRFSHRGFSRRVGQKSPSLLADIVSRRRNLTPELIEAFVPVLGLRADAARFFGLLVELDQADSADRRNDAFGQIAATRRFREARQIEGDSFRYLSNWYIPAVRELARRPDFCPEPGWVSRTLNPTITPAQARTALEVLHSLGMLVEQEDGWAQAEGAVTTPSEVVGLAVHNYHHGMLQLAQEAITRHRPQDRHFMAVTVCIPEALMPRLKDELNAMTERLLDLCDGASGEAERVYQIHLHTFPLSDGRAEEEEP